MPNFSVPQASHLLSLIGLSFLFASGAKPLVIFLVYATYSFLHTWVQLVFHPLLNFHLINLLIDGTLTNMSMNGIHKRDFPLPEEEIHIIYIWWTERPFFISIILARSRQGKELKHYLAEFPKILLFIQIWVRAHLRESVSMISLWEKRNWGPDGLNSFLKTTKVVRSYNQNLRTSQLLFQGCFHYITLSSLYSNGLCIINIQKYSSSLTLKIDGILIVFILLDICVTKLPW